MTKIQRRLANALNTANNWSSDQASGIALLSLGTTRTVHNEDHRANCLRQIARDIAWNQVWTGKPDDVNDPARDIPMLEDLADLVTHAPIGKAWLGFDEFNRVVEELYRKGTLGIPPKPPGGGGGGGSKEHRYPNGWIKPTPTEPDMTDLLEDVLTGYIDAALFSSNDESDEDGGEPLENNYDRDDIDPAAIATFTATCRGFLEANAADVAELVSLYEAGEWTTPDCTPGELIGHRLWLSTDGSGAGFGNGDLPEEIDARLDAAADGLPEVNLYVGDDGKVYLC